MKPLLIPATETTPGIDFNPHTHVLEFTDDSRPENITEFYTEIFNWLAEYDKFLYFLKDNTEAIIQLKCNFKLEYFNSSSAKKILDILRLLIDIHNNNDGVEVTINWYYHNEDEDMLDTGKEFEKMVKFPFVFHELN